jgi:CubicO group peptidase (beta-lactamase class C family)
MKTDAIFRIYSMTKPITSVAAMILVEEGKIGLDDPVSKYLPDFEKRAVIAKFNAADASYETRPAKRAVTLRHLLTHTSGLCYDTWDGNMFRYMSSTPAVNLAKPGPLMFEPGARWQYGAGVDWAGRLVEAVSGQTLEQYFQSNILGPLGMKDTSYILPPEKFDRLVSVYQRQSDGSLKENPRNQPAAPRFFNGGGGLYSTVGDYTRFMQMILRRGRGSGKEQILSAKTVQMMSTNQIGALSAGVAQLEVLGPAREKRRTHQQVQPAPNARIVASFSAANASEVTIRSG